ncbi:dehydrodolichyl diphosphate synthase 6-like isoform X2 [Ananas comosus]|uniref:Alkyl transferase n=1 Tax=Ananas comosus TaxID=4615 RepID=A0A6P5F6N6_ANACO|nr:dehydrodolichyl diphosphate synthase 6-like isoform X2 [Ananas comosus]
MNSTKNNINSRRESLGFFFFFFFLFAQLFSDRRYKAPLLQGGIVTSNLLGSASRLLRKCLFSILSFGPMPTHIAFIMDGNRRYAKKRSIKQGVGHRDGFTTLTSNLKYCYEMGVKYVTVYAFSIDNFKRDSSEVRFLMDLMKEKIDELLKQDSVINRYGARVNFWGNLDLLSEPVRSAAKELMASTASNKGPVLSVCVAYTSADEIMHAVQEVCRERRERLQREHGRVNGMGNETDSDVSVADLEQHFYTAGCPDPDIVIRTSGETRLSNFLLWQSTNSHLQNPVRLWPEFSLRHLIWAILEYQRVYSYLEDTRNLSKKNE